MAATTYTRTRGGRMVHLSDCPYVKRAAKSWPWDWAEGMTLRDIYRECLAVGQNVYACRHCLSHPALAKALAS